MSCTRVPIKEWSTCHAQSHLRDQKLRTKRGGELLPHCNSLLRPIFFLLPQAFLPVLYPPVPHLVPAGQTRPCILWWPPKLNHSFYFFNYSLLSLYLFSFCLPHDRAFLEGRQGSAELKMLSISVSISFLSFYHNIFSLLCKLITLSFLCALRFEA
jgi:hypothetical protein